MNAFHARPDFQAASAILNALQDLTPNRDEVLARLTVAEWEDLRTKLTAVCLCIVVVGDNDACPVHAGLTKNPPSANSSMSALS